MNRKYTLSLVLSFLFAATQMSVAATDATKEIATAIVHAGMAASSPDLKMVHVHLQHTINCLVGPNGSDFNKAPGNPCKGEGKGAIPDSAVDRQAGLTSALSLAKEGESESDLAKAKAKAKEVQEALLKAKE